MKFDSLEDKCLYYRGLTDYRILPNSNIIVMLDGKNFSTLVKNNFKKPFDDYFINMMNNTAKFLCEQVQGCKFAYVQSDEISLLITDYDTQKTDTLFGGRLCKIQSILASLATSEFNRHFINYKLSGIDKSHDGLGLSDVCNAIGKMKMAQFDCKCWTVPNQNDAYAWFLYRQLDCIRNSKQQTAQTYLPNKHLFKKNTDEQVALCNEKTNIDWNDFDDKYKFGRFIFKEENELTTTLPNGKTITFTRNKFTIHPAFELTEEVGKEKFMKVAFTVKNGNNNN